MTKIEKIIEEHKTDDTIVIDVRKYNGSFDTSNLPNGTKILYVTYKVDNKQFVVLDCEVTKRQECQTCSIQRFACNNIDCNIKINKIYKV